eukprot:6661994-Prymnesium_polylepis.1
MEFGNCESEYGSTHANSFHDPQERATSTTAGSGGGGGGGSKLGSCEEIEFGDSGGCGGGRELDFSSPFGEPLDDGFD